MERAQPLHSFTVTVVLGTFTLERRIECHLAVSQLRKLSGCLFNVPRMIGAKSGQIGFQRFDLFQVALLDPGEGVRLGLKRAQKGLNLLLETGRCRAQLSGFGLRNPKFVSQLNLDSFCFSALSFQSGKGSA